jgi:hypothetical protein
MTLAKNAIILGGSLQYHSLAEKEYFILIAVIFWYDILVG